MQPCWILTGTTIRVTTPISSISRVHVHTHADPHAHQTPTATPHSKLRTAPQAQPGAQASSWDGPDPKKQQSTEGTAPLAACPPWTMPCHAHVIPGQGNAAQFLGDQGSYQPDPRPKTQTQDPDRGASEEKRVQYGREGKDGTEEARDAR
ncbi:hypothetical protein BKA56DRAFT_665202 [Ilyonectria sp. MPI-CAGE-AT-0026]|nr:hypothetical protein BKA56DRAFT_665202 [Ilyonectria sp. MPI-CAGE-AT-0026]